MINLIGPARKKQFLAARRNSVWIRYVFILAGTSLAIVLILGGTAFFFYGQKVEQDAKVKENEQKLFTNKYRSAEKEVSTFRKNLTTAKTVLDAETYYSVILLEVAKTMPANTKMGPISLNAATFQGQQTLDFQAKTIPDALALKSAFTDNPPLSSKVRFSEVSRASESGGSGGQTNEYPITITMILELKKPQGSTGAAAATQSNTAGGN